jgi:hypothetical protein
LAVQPEQNFVWKYPQPTQTLIGVLPLKPKPSNHDDACKYAGIKTAVGRLGLCKPFLATAAVWLDRAARRCGLRLRFCVRKTVPGFGHKTNINTRG